MQSKNMDIILRVNFYEQSSAAEERSETLMGNQAGALVCTSSLLCKHSKFPPTFSRMINLSCCSAPSTTTMKKLPSASLWHHVNAHQKNPSSAAFGSQPFLLEEPLSQVSLTGQRLKAALPLSFWADWVLHPDTREETALTCSRLVWQRMSYHATEQTLK